MNKRTKPNTYKTDVTEGAAFLSDSGAAIDFCLKCILTVAFISILSLASIFAYDFITQSDAFNIKKLKISGTQQMSKQDLLKFANLTGDENIFAINVFSIEKRIRSHPWIQSATVKRHLPFGLSITIVEQSPLAIVAIENVTNIIINTQGQPFKEYDPQTDRIEPLPIVSGLDLIRKNNQYRFNGSVLPSIMAILKTDDSSNFRRITADEKTGIAIETKDIYNTRLTERPGTVQIKLGFHHFKAKLTKAKEISAYIDRHYPERIICAMDIFNIEKVFIKTKLNHALHNNLEKGV
ncbi:FtsQ-type POTRA domain-containing protein [Desulfobacula sp.]|uniref:cell division protein FtsQ/DivIB n=1 Tax=Desulfobacula sp. TaxID=2593537 RepID=UPI00260EF19A|nr:FtsQ-type POTRA domain-containing protein [Desulfobacula sp.]